MLRPRIDLPDSVKAEVDQYADENGLRMPRAYADLIKSGLKAERSGE